jgi:hypothetical protein
MNGCAGVCLSTMVVAQGLPRWKSRMSGLLVGKDCVLSHGVGAKVLKWALPDPEISVEKAQPLEVLNLKHLPTLRHLQLPQHNRAPPIQADGLVQPEIFCMQVQPP